MNTGKAVRVALAMNSMDQKELAAKVGVSVSTMSALCNGESATTKSLLRVAKALNMRLSELVALGEYK